MVKIVPIGQKLAEQQARNCKADIATRLTRLTTQSNDAIETTRSNDAICGAIQRRDLRRDPTTRFADAICGAIQRRDLRRDPTTRFDDAI
jgi:hypothetical protein